MWSWPAGEAQICAEVTSFIRFDSFLPTLSGNQRVGKVLGQCFSGLERLPVFSGRGVVWCGNTCWVLLSFTVIYTFHPIESLSCATVHGNFPALPLVLLLHVVFLEWKGQVLWRQLRVKPPPQKNREGQRIKSKTTSITDWKNVVISGSSCDGSQVKDSLPKCLMFGLWPSCHKLREGNFPFDCLCQHSIIKINPLLSYSLCWLVVYVVNLLKRVSNAFNFLQESLPWAPLSK